MPKNKGGERLLLGVALDSTLALGLDFHHALGSEESVGGVASGAAVAMNSDDFAVADVRALEHEDTELAGHLHGVAHIEVVS